MRGRRVHIRGSAAVEADEAGRVYDRRLFSRLWQFIRPHGLLLFFGLLMLPLAAAFNLAQPYIVKLAIDEAIVPRELNRLAPLAVALVTVLLFERLCRYAEILLLQLCGQRAMTALRVAAHRHLLSLRASFFDREPLGKLMTRVTNDIESITEAFSQGLFSVVGDLLTLGGIVIVMFWLSPPLALMSLAIVPLLIIVVRTFRSLIRRAHRLIRQRIAAINATAQEHITGMDVVQIFGQQRRAIETFDLANRAHRDAYHLAIRYDASLYALVELISSATVALLLWYGGLRVMEQTVTFGLLVAFIEYVQRFFVPIRDMSVKYMAMQQAMAASERVFELLDNDDVDGRCPPSGIQAGADAGRPPTAQSGAPAIVFDEVSFAYIREQPVLRGVSFSVARGESLAVVGATGAGKSTLVRLLSRLYELDRGEIRLFGREIGTIDLRELRQRVVVVKQDVYLVAGTVASNISFGDSQISRAAVESAAHQVGLSRVLDLDRPVLERGANLSGGERQLVAFTRALVRDPEVLILDEATASVDPESERLVQEGIATLMRERTSIVIAHRLSTIERVGRILVLHKGELREQGTHAELLARDGIYKRLYELQYVKGKR